MMAQEIWDEVELWVEVRNREVVQKSLGLSCCHYPSSQEEFALVLDRYQTLRLAKAAILKARHWDFARSSKLLSLIQKGRDVVVVDSRSGRKSKQRSDTQWQQNQEIINDLEKTKRTYRQFVARTTEGKSFVSGQS